MGTFLLGILVVVNVVLLVLLAVIFRRITGSSQTPEITGLAQQTAMLHESLSQKFSDATLDMATRLESTKADLREGVTDRLTQGFNEIRNSVEAQLSGGTARADSRLARGAHRTDHFAGADDLPAQSRIRKPQSENGAEPRFDSRPRGCQAACHNRPGAA